MDARETECDMKLHHAHREGEIPCRVRELGGLRTCKTIDKDCEEMYEVLNAYFRVMEK